MSSQASGSTAGTDKEVHTIGVATGWSKERPADDVVAGNVNKKLWWESLLAENHGSNKDTHPYICVLGCGHCFAKSGLTNFKVGGHVADMSGVKKCVAATVSDVRRAQGYMNNPKSGDTKKQPTIFSTGYSPQKKKEKLMASHCNSEGARALFRNREEGFEMPQEVQN